MDPSLLKNVSQVVAFAGTALVLVGSVGIWYFGNRTTAEEKARTRSAQEQLEARTAERDQALSRVQLLAQLTPELDTKLILLRFVVFFDAEYTPEDLDGLSFRLIVQAMDKFYDLHLADARVSDGREEQRVFSAGVFAGDPSNFADRPYKQFGGGPMKRKLRAIDWDLQLAVPNRYTRKLRDLHFTNLEIAVTARHASKIASIAVQANDWVVLEIPANTLTHARWHRALADAEKDQYTGIAQVEPRGGFDTTWTIDLFNSPIFKIPR